MARMALAACVALALLAGCGGEEGSGVSDEQQIRMTLAGYAEAFAQRDYRALCEVYFDRTLVAGLEKQGLPCETALKPEVTYLKDPRLEVRSVKVDGDRASAAVHTTAANQPPADVTLALVRSQGRWQISDLVEVGPEPSGP